MNVLNITPEHIYFIPSVLILGIAIGFLWGQSVARSSKKKPPSKNS